MVHSAQQDLPDDDSLMNALLWGPKPKCADFYDYVMVFKNEENGDGWKQSDDARECYYMLLKSGTVVWFYHLFLCF